jgi:hypothetical protein
MKRLRDAEGQDPQDPLFQRGRVLLQQTPPAAPAADVRQRVWRSLQDAPAPGPRDLRFLVLKVAMVVIVALGAGTAGAVIVQRWIAPPSDVAAPPPAPSRPVARAERAAAIAPVTPAEVTAAPAPSPAPSPKPAARSTAKKPAAPAAPSAAAVARERTEVLDALVALRREHDPARAGAMLARYLSAHPHGALREEALALAMEAADARGDRPGAAQLARTYENEFPAGRFLIFARGHFDVR